MAYKTIRKSAGLAGLVFSIIIVLGLFTSMFLYWSWSLRDAEGILESRYNETYQNLTEAQDTLDANVLEIQESYTKIQEATTGFFSWNGLRLLGSTMKLPISLLTTTIATYTALDYSLDYIPTWAKTLALIGITAFILFLLLSVLRGRS